MFLGNLRAAAPNIPVLASPDGHISVAIRVGDRISYDVLVDERPVVANATLSLQIEQTTLGLGAQVKSVTPREYDGTVSPPVHQKAAVLRDRHHELRLEMDGGYALCFRAYDEGVAYRWETALP